MTTQKQWDRWFFNKWAAGEIQDQRDDVSKGGSAPTAKMFNDIVKAEPRTDTDEQRTNTIDDSDKVSAKLRSMVDAMIVAAPSLKREHAMHFLLHTARGRALAVHMNEISKQQKDTPMLDIRKMIPIMEEGLMKQATINKRDGETDAKAFARKYENDLDFRKSWATITEAKQRLALSMPNMMSVEPVSVEVGNTNVADDSAKAVAQLTALAEKQHRTFEEVFLDSSNVELANRTYRPQQRPTKSSPSYDELING